MVQAYSNEKSPTLSGGARRLVSFTDRLFLDAVNDVAIGDCLAAQPFARAAFPFSLWCREARIALHSPIKGGCAFGALPSANLGELKLADEPIGIIVFESGGEPSLARGGASWRL